MAVCSWESLWIVFQTPPWCNRHTCHQHCNLCNQTGDFLRHCETARLWPNMNATFFPWSLTWLGFLSFERWLERSRASSQGPSRERSSFFLPPHRWASKCLLCSSPETSIWYLGIRSVSRVDNDQTDTSSFWTQKLEFWVHRLCSIGDRTPCSLTLRPLSWHSKVPPESVLNCFHLVLRLHSIQWSLQMHPKYCFFPASRTKVCCNHIL